MDLWNGYLHLLFGGCYPRVIINGHTPVAEEVRELWVYSTSGRKYLQLDG